MTPVTPMFLGDEMATAMAGAQLAAVARSGDAILLSGPLGAGKTALARGFIGALGFAGEVPSPSYALVIPYAPPTVRIAVAHVDLYRLDDGAALDELGLDEARDEAIVIVEWPERMGDRRWDDALWLDLAIDGGGRRLTARVPPSWGARWPFP
jgi:tRNA threonylcarbamoyladenosine biosynthesis protein TsaE